MKNIKNAEKMIQAIKKKTANSEYRTVTMKGIRNLSRADLDTAVMYAETYIRNSGYGFSGLMEPSGSTRELLEKFEII